MSPLTIGQLAGRAGVNVQTLRYYERRGLLPAPARTSSGYRQYPVEAARRVLFIKRAQALGFTLREIEGLLELRVEEGTDCEAVEGRALEAIGRIENSIAELSRMRDALRGLARACRSRRPTSECPVLDALEGERRAGRSASGIASRAADGAAGIDMSDIVVLGGGSAAFAGAIRAAELGARVTMVERGTMGGTCVNVGCVPSKTLIRAAEIRHMGREHPFAGVPKAEGRPDLAALVAQKAELVGRLRQSRYRDVLGAYPQIEYVEGDARLLAPDRIEVAESDGGRRTFRAERVLIATGAKPWVPPIPGLDRTPFWTSTEALEATELPGRLLVIGGSAVGAELAQMFQRLGSRVTLLEALPTLVPNEDEELGRELGRWFEAEGIEVHTDAAVERAEPLPNGEVEVTARIGGALRPFQADRLLVATGRRAEVEGLGLEVAGVETDEKGFIAVDEHLRTSRPHTYAAGDCTPLPQLVYVAARAGVLAAEHALTAAGPPLDLAAVPAVTFTDPQVASVGITERGASERGLRAVVRTLPLEHVPRALANRDTRGLIKLVAREEDGRLLGAHVLSPAAGEVIQTAALAVAHGLTVGELAGTLFPYMTEVEGLRLAAQTFTRQVERLSCCAG